ncbi:MAG: YciI family protein [Myxococcota bacterium]
MQYAILIYESPEDLHIRREGSEAHQEVNSAYATYTKALIEAGVMRGGEELALPDAATTLVAKQGGRPVVQDGPFADVKEQLGGFYIIEVETLDDAIAWASRCPAANRCKVEIRPIEVPPSA